MAQFDVYELRGDGILTVDIQSDLLADTLNSRLVVPLFMPTEAPWQFSRLTPRLSFEGTSYLLATPLMTGLPQTQLRGPLGSLASEHYTIINAVDFLLAGI